MTDDAPSPTTRMPVPEPPSETPTPPTEAPTPGWPGSTLADEAPVVGAGAATPPAGSPLPAGSPTPPAGSPLPVGSPTTAGSPSTPVTTAPRRADRDHGRTASILFGLVFLGLGLWFFAEHTLGYDLPRIRWSQLWPVVLIVIGVWVVLGSMRRGSR